MQIFKKTNEISTAFIENKRFKSALLTVRLLLPLNQETVTENGMAAKLITECCKEYATPDKLNLALQKQSGAKVYITLSKLGNNQVITFHLKALRDKYGLYGDSFKNSAEIFYKLLSCPSVEDGSFSDADTDRVRRFWIDRINGEINNKRSYAVSLHEQIMYEGEPSGIPRFGYAKRVEKVTGKDLYSAYLRIINNSQVRITYTGEDYPKELMDKLLAVFSENSGKRIINGNEYIAPQTLKEVTKRINITQGKMVMGFRMGLNGTDRQMYINTVLVDIFGGGPYSKLFCEVRERLSLCYYCAASANRFKGLLVVDCGVDEENVTAAKDEILRQLEEIKNGNISDEIIKASKMAICNSFKSTSDTIEAADYWYGNRMCEEEPLSPEEFSKLINSVTKEEIIDRAKLIKPDTFLYLLGKENA